MSMDKLTFKMHILTLALCRSYATLHLSPEVKSFRERWLHIPHSFPQALKIRCGDASVTSSASFLQPKSSTSYSAPHLMLTPWRTKRGADEVTRQAISDNLIFKLN